MDGRVYDFDVRVVVHVTINGEELVREDAIDFACAVIWDSEGRENVNDEWRAAEFAWWQRGDPDSRKTFAVHTGDKVSVRFLEQP
jgi:hypothetical protein